MSDNKNKKSFNPAQELKDLSERITLTSEQINEKCAHELAAEMFYLTNRKKESDFKAYQTAITNVIEGKDSEDKIYILEKTQKFFSKSNGDLFLSKGESPELQDQIVKRTGKDYKKQVIRMLTGFHLDQFSALAWKAYLSESNKLTEQLSRKISGSSDNQLEELREACNLIPAKENALFLHQLLSQKGTSGDYCINLRLLICFLEAKSRDEITEIIEQYASSFQIDDNHPADLTLELKKRLDSDDWELVESLLKGWSREEFADEIVRILINSEEPGQFIEDPAYSSVAVNGSLRRNYSSSPWWIKEIKSHSAIEQLSSRISPIQFKAVNELIESRIKYKLTPFLYSCNRKINYRNVAEKLRKIEEIPPMELSYDYHDYMSEDDYMELESSVNFESDFEKDEFDKLIYSIILEKQAPQLNPFLFEVLIPILKISPFALQRVKDRFHLLYGIEVDSFMEKELERICNNQVPPATRFFIDSLIEGRIFINQTPDFLQLLLAKAGTLSSEKDLQNSKALEQECRYIDGIFKAKIDQEEQVERILNYFSSTSSESINQIEEAFLEFRNGFQSLMSFLQPYLPKNRLDQINDILNSLNLEEKAREARYETKQIITLIDLPVEKISILINLYRERFNEDLLEHVRSQFNNKNQAKMLCLIMAVLNLPAAEELFNKLNSEELSPKERGKLLAEKITANTIENMAFELAYGINLHRNHINAPCNFTMHLRHLVVERKLFPQDLSKSLCLLEGFPGGLLPITKNLLHNPDISVKDVRTVEATLIKYRPQLRILQKFYKIMDPECSLRDSINLSNLHLRKRNRLILLLDGFNPDQVAAELIKNIEIGERNLAPVLENPLSEGVENPRIPVDPNYNTEMYDQIRISFKNQASLGIIDFLKKRNFPAETLDFIKETFFNNILEKGETLLATLSAVKESSEADQSLIDSVITSLRKMPAALIEKLSALYYSCYRTSPAESNFSNYLQSILPADRFAEIEPLLEEARLWEDV